LAAGFAVGRGVGFGAGLGVGLGAGLEITTRLGDTDVRVVERAPAPVPLAAVNRYDQRPAGSRRTTENVTPEAYEVPPDMLKLPTPATTTWMLVGAHPWTSW
jgi:hypothetical protein